METICPQCGDKGFANAFVYCVKCLNFAIHRYCLDVIPDSFDELVYWLCDDCEEEEAQIRSAIRNNYAIPFQTRDDIGSENVEGSSGFETKQNHLSIVAIEECANNDGPEQLYDTCTKLDSEQREENKENGDLMQQTKLLKETRKRIKKRKRSITKPTKEKDEHSPGINTSCEEDCDKRIKVCCGLPCDTNFLSRVRDDKKVCTGSDTKLPSKVKDGKKVRTELACDNKKMRTRSCDTKLPSNVKDNKKVPNGSGCDTKLPSNVVHVEDDKKVANGLACDTQLLSKVKDDKKVLDGSACDTKLPSKLKDDKELSNGLACDTKLASKVKGDMVSDKIDQKRSSVKSTKKKKNKRRKKKKKITVISPKNILQEQVHRTDFAQPLVEHKALDVGNQCAEKSAEEKNHSLGEDQFGNGQLEDRSFAARDMNNFYEDGPKDLHISSAEPVAMPIWKGSFNIWNGKRDALNGLLAHVSILACQKVYDEACQFQPVLHLEMLPKSDVWPKSFETSEPCGDNIALYFFPSKSSECAFDHLVDEMMRKELALKAIVQNAELLIFNSSELPLLYWKFQGKYFLWGVFRQKQISSSNSHLHREELKDENPIKHTDETSVAAEKRVARSPCSPLSNSASYGSQNLVS